MMALAIAGVVLAVISLGATGCAIAADWETDANFELSYATNITLDYTPYEDLQDDLQFFLVQTEGDSDDRYTVYSKRRYGDYGKRVEGITFQENNNWNGTLFDFNSSGWRDVKFKGLKTRGVSSPSKLAISVGSLE